MGAGIGGVCTEGSDLGAGLGPSRGARRGSFPGCSGELQGSSPQGTFKRGESLPSPFTDLFCCLRSSLLHRRSQKIGAVMSSVVKSIV